MPIETTGSTGSSTEVPAGAQVEFEVREATFDGDGRFGPAIELSLVIVDEAYYGTQLKYWATVQQPRLDLVRKYRSDGMSDKVIKEALKERGFEFKKIDEKDKMVVGRNGNLYKILTAAAGSPRAADTVLAECDDFEQLAERLVGGRFVATTKKSADGQYIQLDGREEIFPIASKPASAPGTGDPGAVVGDSEEEFDDIPF